MVESAPPLLKSGDLFDDQEVSTAGADKLAHLRIADQLAALVVTVPARSNVALYGPWGSGKSGIGNLVRDAVARRPGTKFARFDAYKYAETPLRRNLISAVATQLGISKPKYHSDLYTGRTRTDIAIPVSRWVRIVATFAGLLFALAALLAVIIALIAWPQPEPYGEAFAKLAGQVANAALVPAALLSALITLSSRTLQVDRTLGKPESDEQFESIFADLVRDSGARRLVVFVDEVDRCSADDVVATLDAIRTFLGTDRCVFLVAADQQVLEESLTRAAKQETPTDEVNPYYSTGSAYLDKVFQYQVSLPPLLSQRITAFAADLVKDRDGLWADISSDYVVSVLVPTHVTSPRRVKHLLNAFALSYRLAEDRHAQRLLATDPRDAAAELAKLVCLRVEFPLFARDLQIDARLPEMVLHMLAHPDDVNLDASWPDRAIERARAYALSRAAPANLLTDQATAVDVQRTALASNQQLLDYLRRTRTVPGPTRDLVFMHSSGAAYGLDGQLAAAIEDAAETADVTTVAERLRGCDDATQRGVVNLLNHLMRTSVGLGARNVASTLLHLYVATPTLPVAHVADSASESIALLIDVFREILDDTTVEAAWNLAAIGTSNGAQRLRGAVLDYVDTVGTASAHFLLRNPEPALSDNRGVLARIAATAIAQDEGQRCVSQLEDLSDATLFDFLDACRSDISAALAAAFKAYVKPEPGQQLAAAPSAPSASPNSDALNPLPIVVAIAALARDRIKSTEVAQQIVLLLLDINHMSAREAAAPLLAGVAPVSSDVLVEAILTSAPRRPTFTWPQWYDAVAAETVERRHGPLLQTAADTLWTRINEDDSPGLKVVDRSVASIQRLSDHLPPDARPDVSDSISAALAAPLTEPAQAQSRSDVLRKLQPIYDAGFARRDQVFGAVTPALHDNFSANFGAVVDRDGPLASYLYNDATTIFALGASALSDPKSSLLQLLSDIAESQWFEEPFSLELQLKLITSSDIALTDLPGGLDHAYMVATVERFTIGASTVAELWLQVGSFTVEQLSQFVSTLRARGVVTQDIADELRKLRRGWTAEQRVQFVRSQIVDPDAGRVTALGSSIVGLNELDDDAIADLLVERFTQCHNNPQRRALIDVWRVAELTAEPARRQLITAVIIGLLQPADGSAPGQGQVEIALDALERLGRPLPWGVKTALGSAVKRGVTGRDKLEAKAVKVMENLGYATERRGLFGRKKGIDYESA
ncbi:hypothetical protein ASD37_12550 [Mycobacterium sp. Root135]|uniref:KAP family P-loop NTPase fold protein n=1 Tax=Mycobacterium sp. Root135 TaxID=1736457 RepID=UPI0006F4D713|nr:P-loop NTPase fold protein [Mycobacterium sp. Root135]KQY06940.1 hypothetical protein ASD37_12550 [Mycobacterium sp. Root135]